MLDELDPIGRGHLVDMDRLAAGKMEHTNLRNTLNGIALGFEPARLRNEMRILLA